MTVKNTEFKKSATPVFCAISLACCWRKKTSIHLGGFILSL
ncbi:hypothetical protein [Staphylococcus sp. OJ82]|nr:hypothetical protein [Staphylococcus sp. OJ82]